MNPFSTRVWNAALAGFLSIATAGCALALQDDKTFRRNIQPDGRISPARTHVSVPLTIVTGRVAKVEKIVRGHGKVTILVQNFGEAVTETLTEALETNFDEIRTANTELEQGLEMILLDVHVGEDNDTLGYHLVLTHDGEDVYELKGEIQPTPKVLATNAFNWSDVVAEATTESVQENLRKMAEEVSGHLLINDQAEVVALWALLNGEASSGGEETTPADGSVNL